ncbi:MAG: tyrosine-type recombinase/integrase [Actinomycetota bacterium]
MVSAFKHKASVVVYVDKGSLALRFSSKYNPIFEQLDGKPVKKQKCMGLGKLSADDPKNWKEAERIALEIEADLSHKDWVKLFDPTFAKYGLGEAKYVQKLAEVLQLPTATPQWTVGKLWEDYLTYKEGQLEPSTFQIHFQGTYTNALKGLKWSKKTRDYIDTGKGIWELPLTADIGEKALKIELNENSKIRFLLALNEAYNCALNLGHITVTKNPFHELHKKVGEDTKQKYQPKQDSDGVWREWYEFEDEDEEENKDCRAFSKEERDIIIKAFYESKNKAKRQMAPLVHFLFLTGCRHGEAFALRWKDVNFERGYIRFSKSYNGMIKHTGRTKNGDIRWFKLYPALIELLQRHKPEDAQPHDLVFKKENGSSYSSDAIGNHWCFNYCEAKGVKYKYPGLVTKLVDEGKIKQYLKPYATRHTFITLQAQAGTDLVLLATICGNSVEIIYKHYLGVNQDAQVTDI